MIELLCPAKVNLFLAVGPKDAAGYHPLRTIFQAIDLCDVLTLAPSEKTEIVCDWQDLPRENTLSKTLRLLSEIVLTPPLSIHLQKRIPAQSGLGGGSSDAAALLKGVRMLKPELGDREMFAVASAVGADVPFFLLGGRAKGEGYGEKLTPLSFSGPEWLLIGQPAVKCSTADAYARLDERRYDWREFPLGDELYNDFERVAPRECLQLIERLRGAGARDAGLSGSGSAVFGRFSSEAAAQVAKEALSDHEGARWWIAKTLDSSELK